MAKVLGIIPARGQSKGIPRKNIIPLKGKPLIAYTIEVALQTKVIDEVIVSTDDEEIAEVARKYHANVPFLRPAHLAEDTTPDLPVYQHVMEWLGDNNQPEIVVWLRPTAPLRTVEDIEGALNLLQEQQFDCVRSLSKVEHHPYWMKTLHDNGALQPFIEGHDETNFFRRQMLPSLYYLNGVVDVIRCESVKREQVLFSRHMGGYVIPSERSMDIDTPLDLKLVETYLEQ